VHLQDIFVVQSLVEKGDWWDVVDVSNSRRGLIPSMAR
jgi:3-methyladenine DNA glycosylase AlkD